jgi:hypothetical protein
VPKILDFNDLLAQAIDLAARLYPVLEIGWGWRFRLSVSGFSPSNVFLGE